jgi:haloacetate dehalogenase
MTNASSAIRGFASTLIDTSRGTIFAYEGGRGPAVLLLHGFPQTGLMWREVAPLLATQFTVVVADMPGYGASAVPADSERHAAMSKREMAATLVEAMCAAGHDMFAVVGHDRGGRVAYRLALDHSDLVTHAAVLDIIPTYEVWQRAEARMALAFWPFSFLAQPAPLPERLISASPAAVVENALTEWGSAPEAFPAWIRQAYVDALRDPVRVHAICEEYRAAATIDREHDKADLDARRRIKCPLLALWSDRGGLANWYENDGGPLGIWRRWADDVKGQAISAGHFFPEEEPLLTANLIGTFLAIAPAARAPLPR